MINIESFTGSTFAAGLATAVIIINIAILVVMITDNRRPRF